MILGIEIGGTKLQLAVGDAAAQVRARLRLAVDPAHGATGIRQQIERELPDLLRGRKISAVGVGFGGPVDWKTGRVARSHQIEGWSGFDLSDWLRELTGAPVVVDNDANAAALGEATHGAGVGFNLVFYVTLGSGVGGGLVVNQRIYHGVTPGEAEIGHLRLNRRGTTVESRCSGWAVNRKIRRMAIRNPRSQLAKLVGKSFGSEARHLVAAVRRGDPIARKILMAMADDLAFGLSHVVHLFHPALIVLGGGLSGLGEPLRRAVAQVLPSMIMKIFRPGPELALTRLGEDAVPVGALLLACGTLPQSKGDTSTDPVS